MIPNRLVGRLVSFEPSRSQKSRDNFVTPSPGDREGSNDTEHKSSWKVLSSCGSGHLCDGQTGLDEMFGRVYKVDDAVLLRF
jgi:hypothetical protein